MVGPIAPTPRVTAWWCHFPSQAFNRPDGAIDRAEEKPPDTSHDKRLKKDVEIDDIVHLTQALALHAEFPVGSTDESAFPSAAIEREFPEDRVRAPLASPNGLVA